MFDLPTPVYPFIFAVIAAAAGRYLGGSRPRDNAASMPAWILYAVALGCVVIGIASVILDHRV